MTNITTITYKNYNINNTRIGWYLYKGTPILYLPSGEIVYIQTINNLRTFTNYPYIIKEKILQKIYFSSSNYEVVFEAKVKNYNIFEIESEYYIRIYEKIYNLTNGLEYEQEYPLANTTVYSIIKSIEISFNDSIEIPAEQ